MAGRNLAESESCVGFTPAFSFRVPKRLAVHVYGSGHWDQVHKDFVERFRLGSRALGLGRF